MSIRLGAIAEIMSVNEKGELVLNTKGAVVLNCGEIPKLKTLQEDKLKTQSINTEDKNVIMNSQTPHEISIKEEEEKEEKQKATEEEKVKENDGADDLII